MMSLLPGNKEMNTWHPRSQSRSGHCIANTLKCPCDEATRCIMVLAACCGNCTTVRENAVFSRHAMTLRCEESKQNKLKMSCEVPCAKESNPCTVSASDVNQFARALTCWHSFLNQQPYRSSVPCKCVVMDVFRRARSCPPGTGGFCSLPRTEPRKHKAQMEPCIQPEAQLSLFEQCRC
jgi:hypothetical protein